MTVFYDITYPFQILSGATVVVLEWISNFNPYLIGYVIIFPVGIKVNPC